MFVVASSQCFDHLTPAEIYDRVEETGFDKLELRLDGEKGPFDPAEIAADPDGFATRYRDATRLTPIAFQLAHDIPTETLAGLAKAAKLLKFATISVSASENGTPFNEEIDRLRGFVAATAADGVRVSLMTKVGDLSEDPDTVKSLAESVKGLGVTLDPSFSVCGPYRKLGYDGLVPYTCHVHLRDTSPEQVQVQVGLGEIDYGKLINKLEKAGKRVPLAIDLFPDDSDLETRLLEVRKLRMLLETLL